MTTPNTPNAAERPSEMSRITDGMARDWCDRHGLGNIPTSTLRCAISDARSIPELDSHRPAESVSAEPVAWMVTRDNDPSFPRIYTTEAAADAMCKFCNVAPTVRKAPLYLHPQPSTPGAVSDEDVEYVLGCEVEQGWSVIEFLDTERMLCDGYDGVRKIIRVALESFAKRSAGGGA